MSGDLIRRSDVYKAVDDWLTGIVPNLNIKDIPSADRPQGEWIWQEDDDICNCSECEFEIDATGCIEPMEYVGVFHFCPNCGARMKGADDE